MKRFLCLLLVIVLLPLVALAEDDSLISRYSCFIDGMFYKSFFKDGFSFNSMLIDFYLTDIDCGYFQRYVWDSNGLTDSGLLSVAYIVNYPKFDLIFHDGSILSGYWDENGDDVWLDMGAGYFRLKPAPLFNVSTDWKDYE